MASYKRKLKDREGNFILPATRSTCVYMNSGIDLQTYLDNLSDEMLTKSTLYPVGSIFHSTSSTSPASLYGGSWEKIQGRMLIGQDSTYTNMGTGGEATHTLSTNEIPSLTTSQSGKNYKTAFIVGSPTTGTNVTAERAMKTESGTGAATWDMNYYAWNDYHTHTINGGGQAHNNMPPWYGCYIWRRTA